MLTTKLFEEHIQWSHKLLEDHIQWSRKVFDDHIRWSEEHLTEMKVNQNASEKRAEQTDKSNDTGESTDDIQQRKDWIENHINQSKSDFEEHIQKSRERLERIVKGNE